MHLLKNEFANLFSRFVRVVIWTFRAVVQVIIGIGNLIFPRSCVLCGAPDEELCAACAAAIKPEWERVDGQAAYLTVPTEAEADCRQVLVQPLFPVYAPNRYTGNVKELVVFWKHANLAGFERVMLQIWRAEIWNLLQLLDAVQVSHTVLFPTLDATRDLYVVNAPSKFRRRFDNRLIAWKLAAVLGDCFGIQPVEALRKENNCAVFFGGICAKFAFLSHPQGYQVANFRQRAQKTRGAKAVRDLSGKQVLLVDDILTTGATLLGSARAVQAAGGEVIGAICFANAVSGDNELEKSEISSQKN